MNVARLLVVDDQAMARRGIRRSIDWASIGVEVVGEAENGRRALELVGSLHPDIVLTDIRMPVMDGLELAKEIRNRYPFVVVVIVSGYEDFEYARRAVRLGVHDYLLKPVGAEELVRTIEAIRGRKAGPRSGEQAAILRARFFDDALAGRLDGGNLAAALEELEARPLRLPIVVFAAMLVLPTRSLEHGSRDADDAVFREIADWTASRLGTGAPVAYTVPAENRFFLMIEGGRRTEVGDDLRAVVADCLRVWGKDLLIGVARPCESVENLARALQEARRALGNISPDPGSRVLEYGSPLERDTEAATVAQGPAIPSELPGALDEAVYKDDRPAAEALLERFLASIFAGGYGLDAIRQVLTELVVTVRAKSGVVSRGLGDQARHIRRVQRELSLHADRHGLSAVVRAEIDALFHETHDDTAAVSGDLVAAAMRLMQEAGARDVSLAGLAEQLGVSPGHLGSLFRAKTGRRFTEVLTRLRVERAMTLLRNPRLRVSEVAEAVGIRDASYFHELFRRHAGMSPGAYRRRSRREDVE